MAPRKLDPKPCTCGCGGQTKTGRFMPGHDQKLRSAIEREVGGLENLKAIVEAHLGHPVEAVSSSKPRDVKRQTPKPRRDQIRAMRLRSGTTTTTQIGYINKNGQMCRGHRGKAGNDHLQFAYKMYCKDCRAEYGANGTDIHLRKCPNCQGGAQGIEF